MLWIWEITEKLLKFCSPSCCSFQVAPRNVSLKELKSELLEQGNQIEKALDLGADIVAVQLINVISNILNSKNDTSSNFQVENKQVSLRQDNTTLQGTWYLHI